MEKNTLNGFEAIVDSLLPDFTYKNLNNNTDIDLNDFVSEELTDEELEAIRSKEKNDKLDDKDNVEPAKKSNKQKTNDDKDLDNVDNSDDVDIDDNTEPSNSDTDNTNDESAAIVGFFDALSEKLGWDDVEEDEKPQTAEELIDYFKDIIETNSKPDYASEEVELLDNFVRNGGNLRDYFLIESETNIDLDKVNLEDDEIMLKAIVKMFLREKGFNNNRIEKMIVKYEDAGILEDEANDALDDLKEIFQLKKKLLLVDLEKQAQLAKLQQQEFFTNVMNEIKGLDNIYGIAIPEKDKKALLEYIFKPNSRGVTKYQEDYAKSLKNLVTSAYFTMKGDTIISIAEKKGKKDAIDNFKNSLTKNTGVNKRSKRMIEKDDNGSIWSAFTRQLRA